MTKLAKFRRRSVRKKAVQRRRSKPRPTSRDGNADSLRACRPAWLDRVGELPVEEAYQPLIASIQRTALVLIGALFLAALAGIFLARRMAVPIQALRAGAARIGGGDLSQRISIKSGDELEGGADQFNDMAGRLQDSDADLEKKVDVRTQNSARPWSSRPQPPRC